MSITISEAQKIGDKKMRAVKSSDLVNEIKITLAKFSVQNKYATLNEIYGDITKRVLDNAKINALFATNDKTCIRDNKVVVTRVLKIRLNDLVYNTRKNNAVRVMRVYENNMHKYALAYGDNVHEKITTKK